MKTNNEIKEFFKNKIRIKDEEVLNQLASNAYERKFNAKEIIIKENDKVEEIPFLISGVLKGYYKDQIAKQKKDITTSQIPIRNYRMSSVRKILLHI